MKGILMNQICLPKETLIREAAKMFAFGRIGNNVELSINEGIRVAIAKE